MSWLKPLDEDLSDGLARLEEGRAARWSSRTLTPPASGSNATRGCACRAATMSIETGDRPARSDARAVRRRSTASASAMPRRAPADRRFARGDGDRGERSRREFRRGSGHGRRADPAATGALPPRGHRRRPADRRARADPRSVVDHGGRARLDRCPRRRRHARPDPHFPRRTWQGDRHRRRSGDARNLRQFVHGDRRGNGGRAAIDRDLGQHQGTARFFLRACSTHGRADRQCAAYPGASGVDGREHPDDHRHAGRARATDAASGAATPMSSTIPIAAERICPTSR